jgi:hypothetical protein
MAEPYKSKYIDMFDTVEEDKPQQEYKSKYLDMFDTVEEDTEEAIPTGYTPPEGVRDLTRDDVFAKIAPYMQDQFGMTEEQHGRQKVVDSYVNHMRKFNAGQSVTTLQELSYLNKLKGTDDQAERARRIAQAAAAYDTFDSMKGAFAEGTTTAEKLDAVGDYARALIVDPMWLVGLGVGKGVAMGSSKAAAQIAKEAARQTALGMVKKKGATEGVRQAVLQQERLALAKLKTSQTFKTAAEQQHRSLS